ncbi:phage major capsid protein [Limimaricola cinnabarinus]|uniref:phage major capsid protein n=1 Tax=Limimaricola cinnabarinus TaxID=1125964 RepID=UPI002FE1CBF0
MDKRQPATAPDRAATPKQSGSAREIIGRVMTRGVTPEQINAAAEKDCAPLMRQAEVREVDVDARTVELAFSSEIEVERWFGIEVLSHDAGAARMERLLDGAPLLLDHNRRDQIGVIESARIDADRRGRAVVRFGKSARAEEIFGDVRDGIRKHVSVGYLVHKLEIEERAGQADLVRVTDWEPIEVSIVSIPADASVGVGRAAGAGNPPEERNEPVTDDRGIESADGQPAAGSQQRSDAMKTKILRDGAGNLVRAKVDEDGQIVETLEVLEEAGEGERQMQRTGSEAERARVREIMDMGDQYGAADLARDHVRDGQSPADFQRALLDHMNGARSASPLSERSNIGLTEREAGQFSFVRAIQALADPTNRRAQEAAAFEFEASEAAAQAMGRSAEGIMVPPDVLTRALNTSTTGTAAGDTGGHSVATDLLSQSFVDMLRNRAVLMRLATPLSGLVGNVDIPKQASGASGYWIGEDEDAPEDNLELSQFGMSPKTVAAFSEITRKLLKQSSLDVEALVRRDLATALALTIDKAGFYGTGAGNQPLGIKNVSGINAVDFGGATSGGGTAKPTWAEVVQMESEIAADNADVNSMAYVMGSGLRGHFKTATKETGTGQFIWENGGSVNGYRSEVTNQIAAGDLFFGNFADLIIGMWGGLDITVDPYSNSKKGRLRIVTMQDVDFAVRRAESFCYGSDAT